MSETSQKPQKPPRSKGSNNTLKAKIIKSIKNAQKANIIKDLQDNLPIVNYAEAMKMIKEAPVKESIIDNAIYNDDDIDAAYAENLLVGNDYHKFIGISVQEPTNAKRAENRARLAKIEDANRASLEHEYLGLQKIEFNK